MPIIYISLGAILLGLIIYAFVYTHQKSLSEKIKAETFNVLESYGTIKHEHHHTYLSIQGVTYQILYVYIPSNAELTINSKIMWEIRDSGKPRLINQQHFLSFKGTKIVIIYPSSMVIKRYINENEMEFVKYNKMFYEMYVVRHFELENLLKELKDA